MDSKNPQSSQKWNKGAGENHDQPLPVYQLLEGIANYTGPPHTQWRPMNHQRSRSSGALIYIPPSHKPSTLIVGERSAEPKLCERENRYYGSYDKFLNYCLRKGFEFYVVPPLMFQVIVKPSSLCNDKPVFLVEVNDGFCDLNFVTAQTSRCETTTR
ncbi:hypothetical protein AGABI1DRAFT_94738 [Agaricus bisporus var. burnettii JB137-S8]|uniref:Uncharacterized protein n=1 Tax=Agaricus bisporus var. burnettii (strain JB137-S8 / ATCC MYA-4627 / FGSC 10392) TaxID=597362 RepID=K5WYK2_AGABU|nr:uncharacterized protein AGABI1DRAFT_94738 [Agaricus bisporus var. burnettii JB137-S8]EKM75677.1 hypothetical protein AGABI1DRAFT_94738 [Agaricus bisporus var. burnettii JB137-S8]